MNPIFGTNLSRAFYEVSMLKLAPAYRDKEPDLYDRKWFDYRTIHPTEATYLWAHAYNEQSKAHYSKVKDTATAYAAIGISDIDVMKSSDMSAAWWARHSFDYIGCPYDLGMSFIAARAIARGHTGMPRPNQCYTMDALIDLAAWWKDRVKTQLTYSRHPHYQAQNFCDSPAQTEHLQFVAEQISKRAKPRDKLVARLFKEGLLTAPIAQRFFPDEADAAERYFVQVLSKS